MIKNVNTLISNIKTSSEKLNDTAESLSTSSIDIKTSNNEIHLSINEISIGSLEQAKETALSFEATENLSKVIKDMINKINISIKQSENMKIH